MADDTITCDVDGCEEQSRYLMTVGERCYEHARDDQPEVVEYCNWGAQQIAANE